MSDGASPRSGPARAVIARGGQQKSRRERRRPRSLASTVRSQGPVSPVAIGRVLRLLATAEIDGGALLGDERHRRETDGLVRAVAERLIGGSAASAPIIGLVRVDG